MSCEDLCTQDNQTIRSTVDVLNAALQLYLVSRLLDSAVLREECRNSPEPVTLAVTDAFYNDVVRHYPPAEPGR